MLLKRQAVIPTMTVMKARVTLSLDVLFTQQKRRKCSNADRVETFLSAVPSKPIDANSFDDEGLKKLFLQYNTTLPFSAAVERIFSLGKVILKPKRCGLSDEHFEMLAFLKGS